MDVDILCSEEKLCLLSSEEEVRKLLTKYKNIFSISNSHIGRTTLPVFDLSSQNLESIADSLRRVPLQKQAIHRELLEKYEELGLIGKIDSPFPAPTVLVAKKNVSDSAEFTDRYSVSY